MLRPANDGDLAGIVACFQAARRDMAYLPKLHTSAEDHAFFAGLLTRSLAGGAALAVEEEDGRIAGFCYLEGRMLDHLYVHPAFQNHGIGSALLDWAKRTRPEGFDLWVFQENRGAQRLYTRAGLAIVRRTDGADNEEKLPDALMRWPGEGENGND